MTFPPISVGVCSFHWGLVSPLLLPDCTTILHIAMRPLVVPAARISECCTNFKKTTSFFFLTYAFGNIQEYGDGKEKASFHLQFSANFAITFACTVWNTVDHLSPLISQSLIKRQNIVVISFQIPQPKIFNGDIITQVWNLHVFFSQCVYTDLMTCSPDAVMRRPSSVHTTSTFCPDLLLNLPCHKKSHAL